MSSVDVERILGYVPANIESLRQKFSDQLILQMARHKRARYAGSDAYGGGPLAAMPIRAPLQCRRLASDASLGARIEKKVDDAVAGRDFAVLSSSFTRASADEILNAITLTGNGAALKAPGRTKRIYPTRQVEAFGC